MILSIIFMCLMISVIARLIIFAVGATWGILKIAGYIIFTPLALVVLFFTGLAKIAFILLVIYAIASIFSTKGLGFGNR
ncbi:hypothetical protein SAMN05216249_105116 [Acetitomaculum ruminis DSM 5522]|uniref:Uncharacterized protein n=1 Tax=Acetitomaculum ruminis DSM 5522 TaxID=1120918 RepID=A0A1I0X060_9FIRM|nr:hypothetical protein [Acetitomaculum ruminis]SFA94402.1 hypothetical protein SAMN05216249_105116 [Acetitomaculum ruminis DSM 5522]